MERTWIWTHGATGCIDYPADFPDYSGAAIPPVRPLQRTAEGLSLSLQIPSTHTVVIPVPSLPLLRDSYQAIQTIVLLFDANNAEIDSLSIHDSGLIIDLFAALAWTGNHATRQTAMSVTTTRLHEIRGSLSVTLSLKFAQGAGANQVAGSVRLIALGVGMVSGQTFWDRLVEGVLSIFKG